MHFITVVFMCMFLCTLYSVVGFLVLSLLLLFINSVVVLDFTVSCFPEKAFLYEYCELMENICTPNWSPPIHCFGNKKTHSFLAER
jgi:hypothetical protein